MLNERMERFVAAYVSDHDAAAAALAAGYSPGRARRQAAELLRRVRETHSLRAAALDMEMAYSKAWKIVKNAEECLDCKLLSTATGGKNGGGATLTPEAEQLLAAYDAYCRELNAFAAEKFQAAFAFLN